MKPIEITMFVSPMGHDVNRIAPLLTKWLEEKGVFHVATAGTCPGAACSIEDFVRNPAAMADADLFFFLCSDEYWQAPDVRKRFEDAVSGGKPVLFFHGLHPCFGGWPEMEKMIGLLWREDASHGDFNYCDIAMSEAAHPITEGVANFSTKDELFCGLSNVWNVEMQVLATAWSDPDQISRWGKKGTGNNEPVLTVGHYGKGRTVDFILGHMWTYYTGHGLLEDSTIAFQPPQLKTLLLRSCEWAASGEVAFTK